MSLQTAFGAMLSSTVTVASQSSLFPCASVTVSVTCLVSDSGCEASCSEASSSSSDELKAIQNSAAAVAEAAQAFEAPQLLLRSLL